MNLREHKKYCKTKKPQRIVYPEEGEIMKFTSYHKMLRSSVVCYVDFESCLKPLNEIGKQGVIEKDEELDEGGKRKKQIPYEEHICASYFTKFVTDIPDFDIKVEGFPQVTPYVGYDAATHFLDYTQRVADAIYEKYIKNPKEMIFTEEDAEKFENATCCHICEKDFVRTVLHCHKEYESEENCLLCQQNLKADVIVRDHSHTSGLFVGAACSSPCNLNFGFQKKRFKIPTFVHNLRGYDGHLILQGIKKHHGRIWCIPTNKQKFLAMKIGRIQLLDSYQFAMQALEDLANTLEDEDFVETRKFFGEGEKFRLMRKKGVFPYKHFTDLKVLDETKLPSQCEFYNDLKDKPCSDEEYAQAKKVWDIFECKTFRDYHNIYLWSDVFILCDFMEKFRETCLEYYKLDPSKYYSTPNLSFDAALKMTKVELDLIHDESIYTTCETGTRGGISVVSKRHSKANNPLLIDFNENERLIYLMYLDMNSLYGFAMMQSLPMGEFVWLTEKEIAEIDICYILSLLDDGPYGYIFVVDLTTPVELHDKFNAYPLAPEHLEIDESMLSPFQQEFPTQYKETAKRLAPNLFDKMDYVVHYRNLKFYLEQGMILKKVKKVIRFKQGKWMKEYIDFNTKCRAASRSTFAQDFFKLNINSSFGKFCENIRKRVNVEIVTERRTALKRAAKPNYKGSIVIHEDLVVMETQITTVKLDRAVAVGLTVLDLSKLHMQKFYYCHMKQWFRDMDLCYTDTDSFVIEVRDQDVYAIMNEHRELFDFSNYAKTHPMYGVESKKRAGAMKDEAAGCVLREQISLRPKLYSFMVEGLVKKNILESTEIVEINAAKGITKTVKKLYLRHELFKKTLLDMTELYVKQNIIRSDKHILRTIQQIKVALTGFDLKRYIHDDGVHTNAFGYYGN